MLIGENALRYAARKRTLENHLADEQCDVSPVRMLVFSGRDGLLAAISPKTAANRARDQLPQAPLSRFREERVAGCHSHDAELCMAPCLSDVVAAQVFQMQRAGSPHSPCAPDELRVELIGPQNLCAHCAEALRSLIAAYQDLIDQTLGPARLRLTLATHWTRDQIEQDPMQIRYGMAQVVASGNQRVARQDRWNSPQW